MRFVFLVSTILIAFSACTPPEIPLPGITGKAGELVVVMPEKNWKSAAGDTVFNALTKHVYGLPQPEPLFNVVHIKNDAFTKIFQTHRNVLIANIGDEHKRKIELKTDVWATPQVVIEIWAQNNDDLIEIFENNRQQIIGHVLKKEQERIQRSYKAQLNDDAVAHVKEKWGLKIAFPNGYNVVSDNENCTWVRYETKDVTQSILIYSEPYTSDSTFFAQHITSVMDKYTKTNVPGPDPGTFMTTYYEYPPQLTETSVAGVYAAKVVGLWNMDGALMGGPFCTYTFLNREQNRVYYVHGFVFAPGKTKRNLTRQIEAIITSTELT